MQITITENTMKAGILVGLLTLDLVACLGIAIALAG